MEPQPIIEPPKPSKLPLIILSILLLVSLALSGFMFYQTTQLQNQIVLLMATQQQSAITPPNSPSPKPPLDPTTNWQTYTNATYRFSTNHAPDCSPHETTGNNQEGQFTNLLSVSFGTNWLTCSSGYAMEINQGKSKESYISELIGHITDNVDSEHTDTINGIKWTKLNYRQFFVTDEIAITLAFTTHGKYGYAVVASSDDIDLILSTFKFTNSTATSIQDQAGLITMLQNYLKGTLTPDKVEIDITKTEGNYTKGTYRQMFDAEGGPGGIWIASYINNKWTFIDGGQEPPSCTLVNQYQVPITLYEGCINK